MFTVCFLSLAVRCQPLSRALGLRREKCNCLRKRFGDFSGHSFTAFSKSTWCAQNHHVSFTISHVKIRGLLHWKIEPVG
ncbi:hypothetical protein FKN12_17615 [Vibrio sp. 2-2(8)]|nr:hypothetical protein [Vibrio sp. 2-2(8)]